MQLPGRGRKWKSWKEVENANEILGWEKGPWEEAGLGIKA